MPHRNQRYFFNHWLKCLSFYFFFLVNNKIQASWHGILSRASNTLRVTRETNHHDETSFLVPDLALSKSTLVIGNIARWSAEGRILGRLDDVHFSDLGSLIPELLNEIDPGLVLSPLFGDTFDVIDVAHRLSELGYKGRYRAISENMPNTDMIRREVCAQSEGLDFDLRSLPPNRCERS